MNNPTPLSPKPGPSNKRTSSQQSARSTKTVPLSSKPPKAQRNLNLKAAAARYNKFSVLDREEMETIEDSDVEK